MCLFSINPQNWCLHRYNTWSVVANIHHWIESMRWQNGNNALRQNLSLFSFACYYEDDQGCPVAFCNWAFLLERNREVLLPVERIIATLLAFEAAYSYSRDDRIIRTWSPDGEWLALPCIPSVERTESIFRSGRRMLKITAVSERCSGFPFSVWIRVLFYE